MENIVIRTTGDSIRERALGVAKYIRENNYPKLKYQSIEFKFNEGGWGNWMISEIRTNWFEPCFYRSETEDGVRYSTSDDRSIFIDVDNHVYFMDN